uniref:RAMA domain-containing protein n=1 Tax=Varanus komodoensis TaxID=61221 RepID=A0A8D2IL32_VARKO
AAIKGDLSLVKSLIASGACVNQKDNAGWTAIHEASNRGFTEIIAELLKAGADVNSKNLDGILPIHDAVSGNHFEAVQLLLLHGANPNELDNCAKNALDEAACSKMKELLKSHGASETRVTPCMSNEHKSINKILQDIKEKQDRLLLFEVKTQRDAGVYIQDLSQIQNILNAVLAKQKSERDDLAKKYRASAESFKQGVLRKQLVKLVSTQKSLLVMAQKQKELGQKIQKYKNMKGVCSRKQVQSTLGACESSNTVTSKRVACPDSDTGLETSWVMESRFLEQDPNQHPNRSLNISGGNGEAINEKEVSPQSLVIEDQLGEYNIVEIVNSKSSDPPHQATLPSDLVVCCSQPPYLEEIDFISVASQGKKVPNATPRICTLNSSVVGSVSVDNINPLSTKAQHVSTNGPLQQCSNINAASHMQPVLELESTHPATHQKNIVTNNRISLNANLEPTGTVFHAVKQLNPKASRRKRNQLLDLLDQGKIKPGDDVLEFVLQNSKHNASLLENGKIRTGNSTVYQNPTQWIKALLGNDITVSWKYVCNKVGSSLFCYEMLCFMFLTDSSYQLNSSRKHRRFLQFSRIVLIKDEEFLPCHIMKQYWDFYVSCKNFGF